MLQWDVNNPFVFVSVLSISTILSASTEFHIHQFLNFFAQVNRITPFLHAGKSRLSLHYNIKILIGYSYVLGINGIFVQIHCTANYTKGILSSSRSAYSPSPWLEYLTNNNIFSLLPFVYYISYLIVNLSC